MLKGLKDNLQAVIKRIVDSSVIDEDLIKQLVHDVQVALLKGDVATKLVFQVTEKIKSRSINEKPPPGLPRKDHIVKILYEEISALLGGESTFEFPEGKTTRVLMLGIQGSGKTTFTSKLAGLLTREGKKIAVIGADTFRPGALVQLKTMCEKSNVEVYGEESNKDPANVVKNGLEHFDKDNFDVILIDTAGRHKQESDLLDELKRIEKVAQSDLALLVIDGTIGMQCQSQAEAFHKVVPVGGIVVTKLDSSAKGGGAIAAAHSTGAQVMYIGTGERVDDIEKFSSTRFVGRILGMGDVQAVLDMAKRFEEEGDEKRMKRISGGKMNMDDFYFQLDEVNKSGSLRGLMESLPGLSGNVDEGQIDQMSGKMKKWRFIIQSMNKDEKADPSLLNSSRIKRVARGSGSSEHDVKDLLKNFKNSKSVMKNSKGRQMQSALRRLGL